MRYRDIAVAVFALSLSSSAFAQKKIDEKTWYQQDLATDSVYGISLKKAYDFLKDKKSTPVIVAVIDGGIDTTHEDLKSVLWRNVKEVPGNKKDDDSNGYVDDINGWNFLGNADGQDVNKEAEEKYRVYYKFKDRFSGKSIDTNTLSKLDKYEYLAWKRAADEVADPKKSEEDAQAAMALTQIYATMQISDSILQQSFKKKEFNFEELEKMTPSDDKTSRARMVFLGVRRFFPSFPDEMPNTEVISILQSERDKYQNATNARQKAPKQYRADIVKDNYNDFKDSHYGNGDVYGGDPMHGTHVSGIIAAQRNNGIGIDGIADNVKILSVRAVPDGDEYDKDIALAIRYAVDNGAKVINMSFGKPYSPEKYWVDSAFVYAQQHDVLLVHAAGNDGDDIDSVLSYPSGDLIFYPGKQATNLITVGASGDPRIGGKEERNLAASFSNYGKKNVDVFAPGVKIYSTVPKGNKYSYLSGTSMASPVVAGVAALIRSYFPQLSAEQVKYVIMNSVEKPNQFTKLPGGTTSVPFEDLSVSGGIINAYNALKLAAILKPEKKK
ncbi:MAG: peptidase S8 [Pseudopedobacter saltans]|uniref:Peptidase S8 n=1 Tax=Pseudopedobacter saltans TaxID=151895 RepID=A0A2W5FEG9_9SPHI|nr:MAG: peptidase S8 [Pseudopedobacter saltans]